MNTTTGMRIGGPCFELAPGVGWHGAGQFDWYPAESNETATKVLGSIRAHGLTCLVFECADGRVRAVPMKAAEARP